MWLGLVNRAIQTGVSCVCATCDRYSEGRARGLPGAQCTAPSTCGSPIGGDTFTHYKGPMTDFTRFCFVCSGEASQVVKVGERERLIGICDKHVPLLHKLSPMETSEDTRLLTVVGSQGRRALLQLLPKPKKTELQRAIDATEEEWAHEDKKRGRDA